MHTRQGARQHTVAREREQRARDREDHPAEISEGRHDDGGAEQRRAERTHDDFGGVGEWRAASREGWSEQPLRADLDQDVDDGDDCEGEHDGFGHCSRGILDFTARHQGAFDSSEHEDQEHRRARQLGGSGSRLPPEVVGVEVRQTEDDEERQREQFGDRRYQVESRAEPHAQHVDRGGDGEDQDEKAGSQRQRGHSDHALYDVREDRRHGRGRDGPGDPEQPTHSESGEAPECALDVRVRTTRERHTAPGLGEAEDHEAHGQGTHHVGEWSGGAQSSAHFLRAGRAKDAASDGDVHDARRQPPNAESADEPRLARRRGHGTGLREARNSESAFHVGTEGAFATQRPKPSTISDS